MNKYIKYLIESFFDDVEEIEAQVMSSSDVIDSMFMTDEDLILKCFSNDNYNKLYTEDPINFPLIKTDKTTVYVCPILLWGNDYGPRKRKKFPIGHFYRFIFKLQNDGSWHMLMKSAKNTLAITSDILNFLENCSLNISGIGLCNEYGEIVEQPLKNFVLFYPATHMYSEKLINNLPKILNDGHGIETKIYISRCNNNKLMYSKLILPIVKSGIAVSDEHKHIYTVEELEDYIVNHEEIDRKQEQQLKDDNDKYMSTLNAILGKDYVDKFINVAEELVKRFHSKAYIYRINPSKNNGKHTAKFTTKYTLSKLCKDNNITLHSTPQILQEYGQDIEYKIILFKIIQYATKLNLSKFKTAPTLYECIHGEFVSDYYGTRLKEVKFDAIPMTLLSVKDLYYFYYLLGYTLSNVKNMSIQSLDVPTLKDLTYDDYSAVELNDILNNNKDIIDYDLNNTMFDMLSINFNIINDTIKNIIDYWVDVCNIISKI